MNGSSRFGFGLLGSALLMFCVSGCVVRDREVVHHDDNASSASAYQQGYQEGYYDREHHRYWHEKAWHDCVENDTHCPPG